MSASDPELRMSRALGRGDNGRVRSPIEAFTARLETFLFIANESGFRSRHRDSGLGNLRKKGAAVAMERANNISGKVCFALEQVSV